MSAQTRSQVTELLARHGVTPSRRLGQNFLVDANITRRIVSEAGVGPGDKVLEIGAGTGTLTRALAATGAHVTVIEVDKRMRPILEEVTEGLDVNVVIDDATKLDLATTFHDGPWHLVANLPYNVGTRLIMDVLRQVPSITRLVVMVQTEVADRLVAGPGDPAYGLPSVVVGIHGKARIAFRVPPQVFYPAPKVESSVVVIERGPAPEGADRALEFARAGFSKRRKMLRASLSGIVPDPGSLLTDAGFDPTLRAENLSPEDYLRLGGVG